MIPAQFDYVRPATLDEALAVLRDHEGEAKVLAGGFSLMPLLKLRLANPALLVDIQSVPGIDGISEDADGLRIGGRATHRRILEDPTIATRYPLLHETAGDIGDPQIRNWGTIGGSCAHADPSADWPAALIAVRATLICSSTAGQRAIPATEFFVDTFETAINPDELLTEIRVPLPGPRSGGAYQHLERRAGDFSTVGAGVQLQLTDDGRIADAGIGLTAVAPAAFAASQAEAVLTGNVPSEELYRQAGAAAAAQSQPVSDAHGPADYKRSMTAEMVVRATRLAVQRARGQA